MYALVEIKGKQYKAEKGTRLKVDKIGGEVGDSLEFDSVLCIGGTEDVKIGTPYVKGVKVKATLEEHGKGKKVLVFKYKKRKGYRRKQGFRPQYSSLKIEDITGV
jgi:large subunit ribosomal protein L21